MFYYKKLDEKARQKFLYIMSALLIADELFKHICSAATGQWEWGFLPLHLCSINIFVCIINSFKRDDFTSEVLYSVCIPGAALALLMPTWTNLPYWNFMSLHSNSIHVLLVMYPLLLLAGGFKPNFKRLPKVFLFIFLTKLSVRTFSSLTEPPETPFLNFLLPFSEKNFISSAVFRFFLSFGFLCIFHGTLPEEKNRKFKNKKAPLCGAFLFEIFFIRAFVTFKSLFAFFKNQICKKFFQSFVFLFRNPFKPESNIRRKGNFNISVFQRRTVAKRKISSFFFHKNHRPFLFMITLCLYNFNDFRPILIT